MAQFFVPWGPYAMAALGAGLLGFGLVSGLLLQRRQGNPYVRPYFMSAFLMAVLAFVVAALERKVLSGDLAYLKAVVVLVTAAYGFALLRRSWTRPLANRSVRAYLVICIVSAALPMVPGVVGAIANQTEVLQAAAHSSAESREIILDQALTRVWTPLASGAVGACFLGVALLMLLFRRMTSAL